MDARVTKAVITSAGKATRMRHLSEVMPKAFFPLFAREKGSRSIFPVVDIAMASLEKAGVKSFCVVAGMHRGILEEHLSAKNVTFVSQDVPRGFGDAVLKAEKFAGDDPVFVHADDGVLTGGYNEAAALFSEKDADCILILRKQDIPNRFTIVKVEDCGEFRGHRTFKVKDIRQKQHNRDSEYLVCAVYVFSPKIFGSLGKAIVSEGELELTHGIQNLIESGGKTYGILLNDDEIWLDVGDVERYNKSLRYTYDASGHD